jgi:hypothetical protein
MRRSRTSSLSGSDILVDGLSKHLVAETPAEFGWRAQIDLAAAQNTRELAFDSGQIEERRRRVEFELGQQVEVAVGSRRALQPRPEP